jgi:hypothetical protein
MGFLRPFAYKTSIRASIVESKAKYRIISQKTFKYQSFQAPRFRNFPTIQIRPPSGETRVRSSRFPQKEDK